VPGWFESPALIRNHCPGIFFSGSWKLIVAEGTGFAEALSTSLPLTVNSCALPQKKGETTYQE
jgi:hypothetical protein